MTDLAGVRESREAIAVAQQGLRDAIVAAHADGAKVAAIADASGFTRQRIYQILEAEGAWVARAEARLVELDGRWDALVGRAASWHEPADAKREQLRRNGLNARIGRAQAGVTRSGRRSGSVSPVRGMAKLPTVRDEARSFAEAQILRTLGEHRGESWVEVVVGELDEAAALRERLEAFRHAGTVFAGI